MKHLNLEQMGVQEMHMQEMLGVDGGIVPIILAGIVLFGAIAPYYMDWDEL